MNVEVQTNSKIVYTNELRDLDKYIIIVYVFITIVIRRIELMCICYRFTNSKSVLHD